MGDKSIILSGNNQNDISRILNKEIIAVMADLEIIPEFSDSPQLGFVFEDHSAIMFGSAGRYQNPKISDPSLYGGVQFIYKDPEGLLYGLVASKRYEGKRGSEIFDEKTVARLKELSADEGLSDILNKIIGERIRDIRVDRKQTYENMWPGSKLVLFFDDPRKLILGGGFCAFYPEDLYICYDDGKQIFSGDFEGHDPFDGKVHQNYPYAVFPEKLFIEANDARNNIIEDSKNIRLLQQKSTNGNR